VQKCVAGQFQRPVGTVPGINLETPRFFYCKLFVTLTMLLTYQFRLLNALNDDMGDMSS
jgi:hypothetical protein